jgi:hypothetical protein
MLYSVSSQYIRELPVLEEIDISGVAKDNPYAQEIKIWKTYATYLYQFLSSMGMMLQILDKTVKDPETNAEIKKALHAMFVAVTKVYDAFRAGIADMQAGKKPEYHFDPVPPPPWPDPDHPQSFFQSIWNFFRPILEQVIGKLNAGSPFATAVAALINSGDEIVKILDGVALPATMSD